MKLHDLLKTVSKFTKVAIYEIDDYWNIFCVFEGKCQKAIMEEDLQERKVLGITTAKDQYLIINIL